MQLIRLATDRADGVFDVQLQEDVELPATAPSPCSP